MRKNAVFSLLLLMLLLSACQQDKETQNGQTNAPENGPEKEDIAGELWEADGKSEVGVIMAHGAAYDAESWADQGTILADNGITSFAVEDTSADELIAAANMLKDDYNINHIALIGASAGGDAAIDAVSGEDGDLFEKVILLSPTGDPNTIQDTPVLVMYSAEEGFDDLEDNHGDNVETIAMPGSAHAQEMFDDEEKAHNLVTEMVYFLTED